MENFDSILQLTEKSLNNIRGIFDRQEIKSKLQELEKIFLRKIFGKIKI